MRFRLTPRYFTRRTARNARYLNERFYLRDSVPMRIACLEHNDSYDYSNYKFLYLTPPDSWELLLVDVHDTYKHMTHPNIAMCIRKLRSKN